VAKSGKDLLKAELIRRELCRRSYPEYLAYTQGPLWKRTRFSEYLAQTVQDFVEADTGHSFDILIVQAPPQHGKSITLTESFPSWYMGRYPERRVILAAYNDDFAERFLRRNKEKIRDHGDNIFGLQIGAVDRATEFELKDHKGRIISRGLRSGITGNPGDLIIVDDPIKDKMEAYSPTFREQLWSQWLGSVKTRLSAGAKVIVIATPWHFDDLMARLIARESNVKVVRIPVEAQESDPLGRAPGEALCPELGKDDAWLKDFKQAYLNDATGGPAAWAAMYMCNPRIEGGNIVKRDWFRTYDPSTIQEWGTTVISVDAAFKGGDSNDFVAITVWSKLGSGYYLRHCSNKKLDFPQTLTEMRMVKALYPEAFTVLVEDKANGSAIISTLRKEWAGVVGVNPKGGKEARVHAVSGAIESGNVYVPAGAYWVEAYLDQWAGFPAVPHDDMVDSSTQALSYMLYSSGEPVHSSRPMTEEEQMARDEEEAFLDGDRCYDVYGQSGGW
jgi:predicted phage terminase large subunit-like protein